MITNLVATVTVFFVTNVTEGRPIVGYSVLTQPVIVPALDIYKRPPVSSEPIYDDSVRTVRTEVVEVTRLSFDWLGRCEVVERRETKSLTSRVFRRKKAEPEWEAGPELNLLVPPSGQMHLNSLTNP